MTRGHWESSCCFSRGFYFRCFTVERPRFCLLKKQQQQERQQTGTGIVAKERQHFVVCSRLSILLSFPTRGPTDAMGKNEKGRRLSNLLDAGFSITSFSFRCAFSSFHTEIYAE
jgi:hypothetical protein